MPKSKCPTKWKVAHETLGEAELHANALRRQPTRRLQQAYKCKCGKFHVGNPNVGSKHKRRR